MLGITIFHRDLHLQKTFAALPVVMATRPGAESAQNTWRVPADDFGPQQCELRATGDVDRVRVVNRGRPIQLGDGVRLHQGQQQTVQLPALLWIGETLVRLFRVDVAGAGATGMADRFVALDDSSPDDGCPLVPSARRAPGTPTLTAWFECLTELQRCIAADQDFFRRAARSIFDPGGLDAGMILLREQNEWRIAASYIPNPAHEISFQPELLELVVQTRQTRFHPGNPAGPDGQAQSLVAAAPLLDDQKQVMGVVYGIRSRNQRNQRRGVRSVEAHFVRLVAQTVAATIGRSRREAEFAQGQAWLRQVFPEAVVQRLHTDPQILEGQQKVVTTMFADIRGFSAISSRLSPRVTWQWITDVMDCWTEIVIRNSGAIVDYYGDGLAAFWNAPLEIENFASLAVICGYQLRQTLPDLNQRWGSIVGRPLEMGCGIATGTVQVGNCGSRLRIKYGPHGRSVILARRLESLTAMTGIRLLICRETADHIGCDFLVRRLFRAQFEGCAEPVEVWQPLEDDFPDPLQAQVRYDIARQAFETRKYSVAVRELESWLQDMPGDAAARHLLGLARSEQGPLVNGHQSGNRASPTDT